MSSPEKKRKKMPSAILPATPIPSLPNDLLYNCFARITRSYYPALSLASKSFRSLIASQELYETRSLRSNTESCLYLCLKFPYDPSPRWFTFCRKPTRKLINGTEDKNEKNPSGNVLAPITIPHSPQAHWKSGVAMVSVGYSIYAIGGAKKEARSSKVSILDCRTNTWREGPSMLVERSYPEANVVDGKIYVTGGCGYYKSPVRMEVYDPETQAWKLVMCPFAKSYACYVSSSKSIDGEIYMFGNKICVGYKPKEDRWEVMGRRRLNLSCEGVSWCTVGDVLYCYSYLDGLQWYNSKMRKWRCVKGFVDLEIMSGYFVEMVDYGGKIAVLSVPCRQNTTMWCAVIALRRTISGNIWGKVEWCDAVLEVPASFEFVCALAATL
ncbi:unnamed protein product [Microthlaspi erraticum]|uniref:F-box domain-containing protein n=1 Tax=Microthlaspi erraticum TaxID=1685480 RepID=A0A6D2KWP1_9BRAS|nr:unnamed protein product [Microthlaspi erraticum]